MILDLGGLKTFLFRIPNIESFKENATLNLNIAGEEFSFLGHSSTIHSQDQKGSPNFDFTGYIWYR